MVYSLTPKGLADTKIDAIAGLFVAMNLFNASWILLWHYLQFTLTLIPIFGLLISLIVIFLKLQIGIEKRPLTQTLLVNIPFGIYLGWATVAVVANVAQVFYTWGWRGAPLTAPVWTMIMLGVASLLGLLMIFLQRQVAYPLVLVWAFIGIWVKHGSTPLVATTAMVLAIIFGVFTFGRMLFLKRI